MNLYVMKMEDVTEEMLKTAKKIDRVDRLILLTDEKGTMSCFLYQALTELKVRPSFMAIPEELSPMSLAFLLGIESAGLNGTLYIVNNDLLDSLNGISFPTADGKNTVSIVITDDFQKIFEKDKKSSGRGRKRDTESELDPAEIVEKGPKETEEAPLNIPEPEAPELPEEDTTTVSEAPQKNAGGNMDEMPFKAVEIPVEMERPTSIELEKILMAAPELEQYKNEIQEAFDKSSKEVIGSFSFNLKMRLPDEAAKKVIEILNNIEE